MIDFLNHIISQKGKQQFAADYGTNPYLNKIQKRQKNIGYLG